QQRHDLTGDELLAERHRFRLEEVAELVEAHLAALEPRPRVGVRVGGVEGADEVLRQPVGLLVAGERLERARQDDAAEVPEHRLELDVSGHVSTSSATAPHSSVDSRNDSWSTRSSSPWNIVPNSSNPMRSLNRPKP